MPKNTSSYWNPLTQLEDENWTPIEGTSGLIEQLTLATDNESGDYTRLTRFKPGANTLDFGPSVHNYPEEIFIISGRLYDAAFDKWLEKGEYASRPPGEVHGPFIAEVECVVLEVSFPSQAIENE